MFTQDCFISKNTTKLRKGLRKLGYLDNTAFNHNKNLIATLGGDYYTYHNFGYFYNMRSDSYIRKCIDCGTNEKLFLAIAALQDDTDVNQWFTDGKTWKNCMLAKCDIDSWHRWFGFGPIGVHKATVRELIEHFKN